MRPVPSPAPERLTGFSGRKDLFAFLASTATASPISCDREAPYLMHPFTFSEVNDEYEIVVVGAGPAGLSVASRLSTDYRVLVIDARPEMPRGNSRLAAHATTRSDPDSPDHQRVTRSWFSPHDCLYDNPDLLGCRKSHGVTRFLARTQASSSCRKDGLSSARSHG